MEQPETEINVWKSHEPGKYEYMVYWPYGDAFNPHSSQVNVHVRLQDKTEHVGTFITLKNLADCFKRFKREGHYSNGTYIPQDSSLIVKEISHTSIVKTIDDLIERKEFRDFFERCSQD